MCLSSDLLAILFCRCILLQVLQIVSDPFHPSGAMRAFAMRIVGGETFSSALFSPFNSHVFDLYAWPELFLP